LGTKHRTIRVCANDFFESLDVFCKYGDQPFAVSSGLGLLAVAKAAQESGVKVLLSGDGADELFGGYSWYSYLNSGANRDIHFENSGKEISFQNFGMDLNARLSVLSTYSPQRRAWAWHYYASENEKKKLFARELFNDVKSSLRFFHQFKEGNSWTPENYIQQDRVFYLPNEMLKKVDRMTMAYSIEGRAPFVAPSVLAHVEKLRYEHFIKGEELKWTLRRAFKDVLPAEIIHRPKHGFNVPVDHWLKNDWRSLMEEAFSKESALFRMGIIDRESADLANEMVNDKTRLNGHTIFTYIMLNRWLERYN
jgi:asparagine synthase (glutamine-hydrolysing)